MYVPHLLHPFIWDAGCPADSPLGSSHSHPILVKAWGFSEKSHYPWGEIKPKLRHQEQSHPQLSQSLTPKEETDKLQGQWATCCREFTANMNANIYTDCMHMHTHMHTPRANTYKCTPLMIHTHYTGRTGVRSLFSYLLEVLILATLFNPFFNVQVVQQIQEDFKSSIS